MQIQIKGTNLDLEPSIKNYAEEKVSSLSKFINEEGDREALAMVELEKTTDHHKQGPIYRAEINLRISGQSYYAASKQEDINTAIDDVKDQMAKELRRSKDKKSVLIRKGGSKIKEFIKRLSW